VRTRTGDACSPPSAPTAGRLRAGRARRVDERRAGVPLRGSGRRPRPGRPVGRDVRIVVDLHAGDATATVGPTTSPRPTSTRTRRTPHDDDRARRHRPGSRGTAQGGRPGRGGCPGSSASPAAPSSSSTAGTR
jgi:hypothetical protein